jgi:hypothetical protein
MARSKMAPQHSQQYVGQQQKLNNGQPSLPNLSRFAYTEPELTQRFHLPSMKKISRKDMAPPPQPITNKLSSGNPSGASKSSIRSVPEVPIEVANNRPTQSQSTTANRTNKSSANNNSSFAKNSFFPANRDVQASATSRKRNLEVVTLSDHEDESIVEDQVTKRIRTVAVPKTMGARVSQLIHGYEQSNGASHQRLNVASKEKQASLFKSAGTTSTANSSMANLLHIPSFDHFSGDPPRIDQSTIPPRQPKSRYFECSQCTIMTPYDLDAHSENRLACGGCGHQCCMDCLVDSVGEECREAEWHTYEGGYMEWRVKRMPPKVVGRV